MLQILRNPVYAGEVVFTGMFVLTYALTLAALIVRRAQGWPHGRTAFSLGRWAWPLTVVSLAYVLFLAVDFGLKRPSINPNLGALPALWEFAIVVAAFGAVYSIGWLRHEKRAPAETAETPTS